MTMLKKIGYGLILWAIQYVTAIPWMGLMQTDLDLFNRTGRQCMA